MDQNQNYVRGSALAFGALCAFVCVIAHVGATNLQMLWLPAHVLVTSGCGYWFGFLAYRKAVEASAPCIARRDYGPASWAMDTIVPPMFIGLLFFVGYELFFEAISWSHEAAIAFAAMKGLLAFGAALIGSSFDILALKRHDWPLAPLTWRL